MFSLQTTMGALKIAYDYYWFWYFFFWQSENPISIDFETILWKLYWQCFSRDLCLYEQSLSCFEWRNNKTKSKANSDCCRLTHGNVTPSYISMSNIPMFSKYITSVGHLQVSREGTIWMTLGLGNYAILK